MSLMTWVAGLLLFCLEGYLEGSGWMAQHLPIAAGLFLGAWIWILVLSLLALGAFGMGGNGSLQRALWCYGVFFVASGFGGRH